MSCNLHTKKHTMDSLLRQMTRGNALFLIVALGVGGSFQNGYHVTGLSSPSPFIQSFINSSWYSRYKYHPPPKTVTMIWSVVVSVYAVGGLLGAVSVRFISHLFGRKKAVLYNSCLSITAGAIMLTSKHVNSFEMIIAARCMYGYSTGLGISTHLMYLGESSPRNIRGSVTLTVAIFASLGKLSGQFFGLSELLGQEELWNVLLCVPACFSMIQLLMLPFLPEAPKYLFIEKCDSEGCREALQKLWGPGNYKQEMEEMMAEQAAIEAAPPKSTLQLLKDRTVRWQLITMLIIYSGNQMSGMPAISVFSFDIFLKTGVPIDKIRYITLGLGICEILTSISCGLLIEHIGRRPLLWGGYGAMSATWVLITVTLNLQDSVYWLSYISIGLFVLIIVFFSGGPGLSTPALNHELFIQSNRVAAFVITGLQRWLMSAILGLMFPFLIEALYSYSFVLFSCTCLLASLYTFLIVPETKGKTLLEISSEFQAISVCRKSVSQENTMETKF